MALPIHNLGAEQSAQLAAEAGERKTETATKVSQERLGRVRRESTRRGLADELQEIAEHCASLPVLDNSRPEAILGYD